VYVAASKLAVRALVRATALMLAYSIASFRDIGPVDLIRAAEAIWPYVLVFLLTGLGIDVASRTWRRSWRFTSLKDVLVSTREATIIALALLVAVFILDRGAALPRSAFLLTWLLDVGLFNGLLLLRRAAHENTLAHTFAPFLDRRMSEGKPLLLLGRLEAIDSFLRELSRQSPPQYRPVGCVAETVGDARREVRGVRALGHMGEIKKILDEFGLGEAEPGILFLDGAPPPADLDAEAVARLKKRGVRLLRTNRITDLQSHLGPLSLTELDVNDLLARPPVNLDPDRVRRLLTGKRVLVTGAGGSIGSEICRQVAASACAHLAMMDNSEFGLFKIDQEIGDAFPTLSRSARLCDVRDAGRVRACLTTEAPEIVFHAAALKHVPLMESHPSDSILTNVVGSGNVADASVAAGVKHFIFISTDKAVDPPNVMGATKRLAERTVCQRRRNGGPKVNVVRFGNVLGSAGSVVPTFLKQISRGGPLTLTHPDIERYFMTIPEAVQLVLHATAKSAFDDVEGVLVLDMGEPVKIIDLARRLIELQGLRPGTDIEIRVTGLRPGEKMTESLVDLTETATPCDPSVMQIVDSNGDVRLSDKDLSLLEAAARRGDDDQVRKLTFELLASLRTPRTGNLHVLGTAS
jgi:O-antigen biosynthesis protein WbqV